MPYNGKFNFNKKYYSLMCGFAVYALILWYGNKQEKRVYIF